MALLAFQIFCALVFVWDVSSDFQEAGPGLLTDLHLLPEALAVVRPAIEDGCMGDVMSTVVPAATTPDFFVAGGMSAAIAIVEQHGGVVPADLDALLALPGIGPKSAQRIAFHILAAEPADVLRLARRAKAQGMGHVIGVRHSSAALPGRSSLTKPSKSSAVWKFL